MTVRGKMQGRLLIKTEENGAVCGEIPLASSGDWKTYAARVRIPEGRQALYFCYEGRGKLDFLDFTLQP